MPPNKYFSPELETDELKQVEQRRALSRSHEGDAGSTNSTESGRDPKDDGVGVALSGGGIRSATFCLGLFQGLAKAKLIRKVDYLSTVSGGGYFGSFLGRLFTRDWIHQDGQSREQSGWCEDDRAAVVEFKKAKGENLPDWFEGVAPAAAPSPDTHGRVEKILGNSQSAPLRWLRDSGRYIAPGGGVSSFYAGAVALRNWVAVMLVVTVSLLAAILCWQCVHASLWHWDYWRENVESPLALASGEHLWFSPLMLLAGLEFLAFVVPMGWAYWLTQSLEKEHKFVPLLACVITGLANVVAVGYLIWCDAHNSHQGYMLPCAVAVVMTLLTLAFWALANSTLRRPRGRSWLAVKVGREEMDKQWHRLSLGLTRALVVFGALLVVALVDSVAQSAYAVIKAGGMEITALKSLLAASGLTVFIPLAKKALGLFEKGGSSKIKMPLNVIALVAAILIGAGLLVGLDMVANGIIWNWSSPRPLVLQVAPQQAEIPAGASRDEVDITNGCDRTLLIRFAPCSTNVTSGAIATDTNRYASWIKRKIVHADKESHPREISASLTPGLEIIRHYQKGAPAANKESHTQPLPDLLMPWVLLALLLLLTWFFGVTITFLNLSSHHSLYSRRIVRAYQGASNPRRWFGKGQKLTETMSGDDSGCKDYNPHRHGGPLHFVNATLNETVSGETQTEYRDRRGMNFCIGPAGLTIGQHHARWADSRTTHEKAGKILRFMRGCEARFMKMAGHFNVEDLVKSARQKLRALKEHRRLSDCELEPLPDTTGLPHPLRFSKNVEPLTVGQWVGISGAAFSTGIGAGTSLGKSLLCGIFNVRLGYWWLSRVETDGDGKSIPCAAGFSLRDKTGGCFSEILPVQSYLIDEFLARFHGPRRKRWYLTDGGHFENTAAYELIRRRVPFIIVSDNGQDADGKFEDLANLVRIVRIDFGAEIKFLDHKQLGQINIHPDIKPLIGEVADLAPIVSCPGQPARTRVHAALAWVEYPGHTKETPCRSFIVWVKPGLNGDEPIDVQTYQKLNPDFPQQSTLDQFFDEAQWESYRRLGEHIGGNLFAVPDADTECWYPGCMAAPKNLAELDRI